MDASISLAWKWFIPLLILMLLVIIYMIVVDALLWLYLPPGPLPIPFIGNIGLLIGKKEAPWQTFQALSEIHGPMFTFWFGRTPRVIITDPVIATQLLTSRGGKYSSRPQNYVFGTVYYEGSSFPFLPYGPAWAFQRKVLHNTLKPTSVATFHNQIEAEASKLVADFARAPEKWKQGILRFSSSVSFCVAYGRRIDSLESTTLAKRVKHIDYGIELLRPGRFLVDTYPILRKIPEIFTPWLRDVRQHGKQNANFDISLMESTISGLKSGSEIGRDSFLNHVLKDEKNEMELAMLSKRHLAALPAILFSAGAETTSNTLHTAIFALMMHPRVLKIAEAEIVEVVGTDRSPTFADKSKLVYLNAIIQEVLRWRPAVPAGVPHTTSEADVFEGYKFPKGITFLPHTWCMNHSPTYFPNPSIFHPERYLPSTDPRYLPLPTFPLTGTPLPFPGNIPHATFGFGRRACVGIDLAINEMYIALSKIIWAFEISKMEGEQYNLEGYEGGMMLKMREFRCVVRVRSPGHRDVIEREMSGADRILERFPAFE